MAGVVAFTLCSTFTSCSHDEIMQGGTRFDVVKNYEQTFITRFGQPAPDQDWGFGKTTTSATRSITVNGDIYDKFPSTADVANKFPTSIPEDADEMSGLLDKYKGTWVSNQYNPNGWAANSIDDIFLYIITAKEGHNLKITQAGDYKVGVGGLKNNPLFNVYINVEGNVNLTSVDGACFNIYILKGNVTFDAYNFGNHAGIISVGENATLTDKRENLQGYSESKFGIQLYNRGTVKATATKYDISNKATVYNEGTFTVTGALTYSPGDGLTSYFVNFSDDAKLTAASMTLNSCGNFYNDGTVTITGETNVTQKDIYWVNAGHYTTGSMKFSAKNDTFYNYCQLIVQNNCTCTDGVFNLMDNSYAEFGTALFNNFYVNMGDNSGFNVKNGCAFGQQGQGTPQGFYAKSDNAKAYVRLGGLTKIMAHKGSAFHAQGANLTLAYEEVKFYEACYYLGTTYAEANFGVETTQEALEAKKDERSTWNLHNVTKFVTGDDFKEANFSLKEGECAATWSGETEEDNGGNSTIIRIIAEDLTVSENSDFDFNDVVFDVEWIDDNSAKITLQAAGGTLPLTVGGDEYEVHKMFGLGNTNQMINTGTAISIKLDPVSYTITGEFGRDANKIPVKVCKFGEWIELKAPVGKVASKIALNPDDEGFNPQDFIWCDERIDIESDYEWFPAWVKGEKEGDRWYAKPTVKWN